MHRDMFKIPDGVVIVEKLNCLLLLHCNIIYILDCDASYIAFV